MNNCEEAAMQSLSMDLFRARRDLHHERQCIDEAVRILRAATEEFLRPPGDADHKLHNLAVLVDQANDALKRAEQR